MLKRLPTFISGLRLLAGPLIFLLYILHTSTAVIAIVFLIAAITDFLDGVLARRLNACTAVGAWLDHLSDKVLVTSALWVLCMYENIFLLHLLSWLIVQRELIALAARSYPVSGKKKSGESFAVNILGKWKTVSQCASIFILLLSFSYPGTLLFPLGMVLLGCSAFMAWISLANYFRGLFLAGCVDGGLSGE